MKTNIAYIIGHRAFMIYEVIHDYHFYIINASDLNALSSYTKIVNCMASDKLIKELPLSNKEELP